MEKSDVMRSSGEAVACARLHRRTWETDGFHLSVGDEDRREEGTADNGQGGRPGPLQPPLLRCTAREAGVACQPAQAPSHGEAKALCHASCDLFYSEYFCRMRSHMSTICMPRVPAPTIEAGGCCVVCMYPGSRMTADQMLISFLAMQSKTHIGNSRRMKNPEKLAASKKKPLVARYILKNRVILTRDPTLVPEYAT